MTNEISSPNKRELKPEQQTAAHTLDRHLSVTAGPGAGKTFVLVERYLEILRTRKVSVDNIVAITFTNRAANEMRQRVRTRIDEILRHAPAKERPTWLRHKRTLEGAVITTIHGFCSRLLHEFPVEANIDPQFVLLDEHQAMMLIESVVEEALADAIHRGDEKVLQYAQGTGRAAMAKSLIELHRKYRDEGLSLDRIEELTAQNHISPDQYDSVFGEVKVAIEQFVAKRLTKATEKKRAQVERDWPVLRELLSAAPGVDNMAAYCQAIEDLREWRPDKRSYPPIERLDELLWGQDSKANDFLRGSLPAIGFDLLAKQYALALLKLLREIERRLDAEKQRLSVLDFDDLQLRALRLLERPEVLTRVSERYRYFLVDEFQDTNGLQRDLLARIALLAGANLFIVGDRKQSIYGFRGADVDVFAEMTAAIEKAGGAAQPLSLNFRSQKPLVDSFNFLFARIFQARTDIPRDALGELGYVAHEPSVGLREAEHDPPLVELMVSVPRESDEVTEANGGAGSLTAHELDAEQVAARIRELVSDNFEYKDVAVLLRAFTGVWTYESALRRAGIPYLTVQGKGFYQREEIQDLIQLLRFLDNTTDELALAAVLRSPLAGVSDNALLALRCAPWVEEDDRRDRLHRRNLLRAIRRHREIKYIDPVEHEALDQIVVWLESLIERRHRYGIADLLRYAVSSSEFTTVIAANFDGAQRIANVEKLFRLAEQFEKREFLIRDFMHYVEEFEAIGGREGEGQMDETANVVRLMTIHQAKGLEFPVVVIPDLHRDPYQRNPSFMLDRHRGVTVRIPDGRGRTVRGALFNELSRRNRWREEFESMRLLYVAATRAEDRLILSGAIEPKELENLTKTESEKWLAWVWQALELSEHPESGELNFGEDVQFQVTINRDSLVRQTAAAVSEKPGKSAKSTAPLVELFPLLRPVDPVVGSGLRRMTVTQLINFQRCSRQYYFDRLLRTPGAEERAVWNDAEAPEPPANLTATLKGAVIHRFCETFSTGDDPVKRLTSSFEEVLAQRKAELAGRTFEIDESEAVRALLPLARNYLQSDVYRRVAQTSLVDANSENHRLKSGPRSSGPQSSSGLWSELRFRLRRKFGILTGTIDKLLIAPAADGGIDVEIIDFKTNRFSPASGGKKQHRAVAVVNPPAPSRSGSSPRGQGSFDFEGLSPAPESAQTIDVKYSVSLQEQILVVAADYQLQMQAYALALRELLSANSPPLQLSSLRATLHFLDPNEEFSLPDSLLEATACAGAIDEAMNEIAILDATLEADRFPPHTASHCRMCNFRDLCPAGREWLKMN